MITILAIILINFSNLFAAVTKDIPLIRSPKYLKLSFEYKINSFSLPLSDDSKKPADILQPYGAYTFTIKDFSQKIKNPKEHFSLETKNPYVFSLDVLPYITATPKNKKHYLKTAIEITGNNVTVWAFNWYVLEKSWADISLRSIFKNFKDGLEWDIDPFIANQFMHPYHGAIHYSIAKANGLNYFESTICTLLGSFMHEFFLEARGKYNNPPSTNDLIMNTLGGATLGEVLFRTADLVVNESSTGFERALRGSLAFLINPACGFRAFSGKAFKKGNPLEKHYYSLELPFGAYISSTNKTSFIVAANLEYKDFLEKDPSEINLYDWFTLDFRLGFNNDSFHDKEIVTTGVLTGKRIKNGLAGLFGVFDYIDTLTADKISAVGVGPGLVTIFVSNSDFFFNSSGVLSVILGGSSPSFDLEDYHFGKKFNTPYYFGPGMLGRIKLELGKKGLGSIDTGFSQYWVHSIFTHANEFLGILSFAVKCDLSDRSQISLGYDYYLRHATYQEQRFTGAKPAVRALYILKF